MKIALSATFETNLTSNLLQVIRIYYLRVKPSFTKSKVVRKMDITGLTGYEVLNERG